MSRFLFITDCHFAASSNVRAGDYLKDLCEKLEWVVSKANELDAVLLDGGDFFDKPSVPDLVKIATLKILAKLNHKPLFVRGNHCTLYNSIEFNYKTSLSLLEAAGVLTELTPESAPVDFGDCEVTAKLPFLSKDKPQILLRHGFLNREDGPNTVMFTDLQCDTDSLVLLGHDHEVYDPITYRGSTIIRPGSFARAIRVDSADRTPKAIFIEVRDGGFFTEELEIPSKQVELLFKQKLNKLEKSSVSYQDIIDQIRSASKSQDSLFKMLQSLTDDTTISYIENAINEFNQNKRK